MLTIEPADTGGRVWANEMVARHHYLRKPPDPRSRPLAYLVRLAGEPVGCLFFGRPESTRCYRGGLTYGGRADVASGRAAYDRWEVLNLSRVWLSPDVQAGGRLHSPDWLPGYVDRAGVWRSAAASAAVRTALGRVGHDYLAAHPPCFLDLPYAIRAVLSYCDTRRHRGTIYAAAGMRRAWANRDGIETWWTPDVRPLTPTEDERVRAIAARHPRSVRIRNRARTLFAAADAE